MRSFKNSLSHFAPIPLDATLGMGRVAVHWRDAFIRRGWSFNHVGINEVPMPLVKPLWANRARNSWQRSGINSDFFLAHEPYAETFRLTGVPTILFSHGLEVREKNLSPKQISREQSLKSFMTKPFWEHLARQRENALRKCPLLLLINEDDKDFVISNYSRSSEDIFVFQNGVNISDLQPSIHVPSKPTILFYGTWLERKGSTVLIQAALQLARAGIIPRWLLVGTGKSESEVLSDWPINLRKLVEVHSKVSALDDDLIYEQATIFVLPSFFEGQPLTLLQAMESGRCVISTRCCGQKDIINHEHNGFLMEPGNAFQLADLIANALSSPDLLYKTGSQAKLDMSSRRWHQVADQVVDRLESFFGIDHDS